MKITKRDISVFVHSTLVPVEVSVISGNKPQLSSSCLHIYLRIQIY